MKKGEIILDLILFLVVWILINIGLIYIAKEAEKEMCSYETAFCRDVRASLGMFAYLSKLEETRQKLNRANSKF